MSNNRGPENGQSLYTRSEEEERNFLMSGAFPTNRISSFASIEPAGVEIGAESVSLSVIRARNFLNR